MAPPKKPNNKPLSAIENSRGRDTHSNRGNRNIVPTGTENRRNVATSGSNSSRGRANGRGESRGRFSVENSCGRDSHRHSSRDSSSDGTDNRRAGIVTGPNSSRGRANGRANGRTASGRGESRGRFSVENSPGSDSHHHSSRDSSYDGTENQRAGIVTGPNSSRGRANGRANGTTASGREAQGGSPVENSTRRHHRQRSNRGPRLPADAGVPKSDETERIVVVSEATPTLRGILRNRNTNESGVRTRSRSRFDAEVAQEINPRQRNPRNASYAPPGRRAPSRVMETPRPRTRPTGPVPSIQNSAMSLDSNPRALRAPSRGRLPVRRDRPSQSRSTSEDDSDQDTVQSLTRASRRRNESRSPDARGRGRRSVQNTRSPVRPTTRMTRSKSKARDQMRETSRESSRDASESPVAHDRRRRNRSTQNPRSPVQTSTRMTRSKSKARDQMGETVRPAIQGPSSTQNPAERRPLQPSDQSDRAAADSARSENVQSGPRRSKAAKLHAKIANSTPGSSNTAPNRSNDASEATAESRPPKRGRSTPAPATGNRTRFVDDDENSQPSTSTAPPRKICRLSHLNSNPSNNRTRIDGSSSGFVCCEEDVTTFTSFIKICQNGCKIEVGKKYRTNTGGTVFCGKCFRAKKVKEGNWKEHENRNRAEERTVFCQGCNEKYHKCCTLDLQKKKFTCPTCTSQTDLLTRTTLADYSKIRFELFMEKRLNDFVKARLNPVRFENPISVVSYKDGKKVPMRDIVPPSLRNDFSKMYKEEIEYYVRMFYVFQRIKGVDVLVFAMICHEYKDILGKSWTVIDYLDSNPYTVCRGVNMEAILSYLAWAKDVGFNHAHFYSNPPQQGTDYILSIKPKDHKYMDDENLLSYYNYLLKKGKAKGILAAVRTLEEDLRENPYSGPTRFLPFNGGLWPSCMLQFDGEITGEFGKLPTKEYFKKFDKLMKERMKDNGQNNFFIDLNLAATNVSTEEDPIKSHIILGDRDQFLGKCRKENWEFSSLRRAKYSSVAIIDMMMNSLDQKKKQRGLRLE